MALRPTVNETLRRMMTMDKSELDAMLGRIDEVAGQLEINRALPPATQAQQDVLAEYMQFSRSLMRRESLIQTENEASEDEVKDFAFPPNHATLFDQLRL